MKHIAAYKLPTLIFAFLLLLGLWVSDGGPVSAHASLARSEPGQSQVLPEPANRVSLWFTEALEPSYSSIQVLDAAGQRVDQGDSAVNPSDATNMYVNLKPLAEGIYTVSWRNLSAVDGHRLEGAFVFSVGVAITGLSALPAEEPPLVPSPLDPVLRWALFASLLAIVGGAAFDLFVVFPTFFPQMWGGLIQNTGRAVLDRSRRSLFCAVAAALLTSVLQLLLQNSLLHESFILAVNPNDLARTALNTAWGNIWLWRAGFLVALLLWMRYGWEAFQAGHDGGDDARQPSQSSRWPVLVIGLCALLTVSATSHAAATSELATAALANDFLHLAAASLWAGGLLHFALSLPIVLATLGAPERRETLASLTQKFSLIAGLSVLTLIGTGLFSGWTQVTVLEAMPTPYGFTLGAKLMLVAALLGVGALNLLLISPELRRNPQASVWIQRSIRAEVAVAAGVLLATGFLTTLEPARQVASRLGLARTSVERAATVETTHLALKVEPAQVGGNRVQLTLHDLAGNPITNATDVAITLSLTTGSVAPGLVTAQHAGDGRYTVDEAVFPIMGAWNVDVQVRRPDAFDTRAAFQVQVASAAGQGGGTIYPSAQTGRLLWGIELSVLGFLFLGIGVFMGGWRARRSAAAMGLGMLSVLAGLVLTGVTLSAVETAPQVSTPPPVTQESVLAGRQIFESSCVQCHGPTGHGDGPLAASLNPKPQDLAVHVALHPERDLFNFIKRGVPGTAMPAWGERLTDEQIWQALYYIQSLVR